MYYAQATLHQQRSVVAKFIWRFSHLNVTSDYCRQVFDVILTNVAKTHPDVFSLSNDEMKTVWGAFEKKCRNLTNAEAVMYADIFEGAAPQLCI